MPDIRTLKAATDQQLEQMILERCQQIAAIHKDMAEINREISVRAERLKYKHFVDQLTDHEKAALQQYLTDTGAIHSTAHVGAPSGQPLHEAGERV